MFLSVIIPAHNEERRLPPSLKAIDAYLNQQSYESEVLVVEIDSETRLKGVLSALLQAEVNIHYAYAFITQPNARSALALSLEDPEIALLVDAYRRQASIVDVATLPPLPHKDRYRTSAVCQACHVEQYDFWKGTKHGTAFASLEETGDQWRQDCIPCHVLGYGQAFIAPADADPVADRETGAAAGGLVRGAIGGHGPDSW